MQISRSSRAREEIQYFPLDFLPKNHILVYDHALGILSLLACEEEGPLMLNQQRFVGREPDLLLALLTGYPQYAPYEVLHVSFYQGFARLAEDSILQAKQRLDQLRAEEGLWSAEVKYMRNVMARLRLKLHEVSLDAVCMIETGYLLTRSKEPRLEVVP